MKTIRFGKKEDSTVIDIEDVNEDSRKIYCAKTSSGKLMVSVKLSTGNYCWTDMTMGCLAKGISSLKETLQNANTAGWDVLIFDSQCEVLEYAKKL